MECGGAYAKGVNVTDSPENKKGVPLPLKKRSMSAFLRTEFQADTVSYRDFPDGGSVRESAHDQ